jgi:hypothetical protein
MLHLSTRTTFVAFFAVVACVSACGGDDKKSGDFSSIAAAIESPSGKISSAGDAKGVAAAYQEQVGNGAGAGYSNRSSVTTSWFQQGQTEVSCAAGGTQTIAGSGNGQSGTAEITFDNCCHVQNCCMDGEATWYYSTGGTAQYQYCGQWELTTSCGGSTTAMSYEGCVGAGGTWYLVEFNGQSYAVQGSYSNGSGAWKVKSSNGTWECNASNNSGSCSDGTTSITW